MRRGEVRKKRDERRRGDRYMSYKHEAAYVEWDKSGLLTQHSIIASAPGAKVPEKYIARATAEEAMMDAKFAYDSENRPSTIKYWRDPPQIARGGNVPIPEYTEALFDGMLRWFKWDELGRLIAIGIGKNGYADMVFEYDNDNIVSSITYGIPPSKDVNELYDGEDLRRKIYYGKGKFVRIEWNNPDSDIRYDFGPGVDFTTPTKL